MAFLDKYIKSLAHHWSQKTDKKSETTVQKRELVATQSLEGIDSSSSRETSDTTADEELGEKASTNAEHKIVRRLCFYSSRGKKSKE